MFSNSSNSNILQLETPTGETPSSNTPTSPDGGVGGRCWRNFVGGIYEYAIFCRNSKFKTLGEKDMKTIWYALTIPIRVLVIFVCAVALVTGVCLLQVFGGEK
jgi:hypothetical protein